ncbi:hypothetical protein ES708_27627 [subsurface metagenome]
MGKVIVAFTQLEDMISVSFSLLLGCEPQLASILANALPTRERCDTLFHIFAYRFGSADSIRTGKNPRSSKNIRLLSTLFTKINEAATIRNTIVHSSWSASDEDKQQAHRLKWTRKRAQPGFPSSDYSLLSPEDILKHVDFIDNVRHELHLFLWDNFSPWFQQRAKNGEGGLMMV